MTLDALFAPRPAPATARLVSPLGEWPEADSKLRKLERWNRYRQNNRERRAMAMREYRARKAA